MNVIKQCAAAFALFAIPVMAAGLLAGCEPESRQKTAGTKPVIGVLVYKQDDTYVSLVTKAMQEALSGWAAVEVLYAEADQMLQNEQIDALLKKNVRALAVNIVETQASAKAVDAIKKAGVPAVFFNREPDLHSLKDYSKACFVGTNAFDAGIIQGDIITDLWRGHPEYDRNGDGKCQYIMIQANLDNPEALARTEYSVKQARANGIGMQQVGETLLCNWDESLSHQAMRLVFPYNDTGIELVIANNDSMALGAIKALNESGYNLEGGDPARFIPVVGVDAIPLAMEAIRKGVMSGTVVQDGDAMGKAVAAILRNAVNEKECLEGLPYSWDDSGTAIRIPYFRYTQHEKQGKG